MLRALLHHNRGQWAAAQLAQQLRGQSPQPQAIGRLLSAEAAAAAPVEGSDGAASSSGARLKIIYAACVLERLPVRGAGVFAASCTHRGRHRRAAGVSLS